MALEQLPHSARLAAMAVHRALHPTNQEDPPPEDSDSFMSDAEGGEEDSSCARNNSDYANNFADVPSHSRCAAPIPAPNTISQPDHALESIIRIKVEHVTEPTQTDTSSSSFRFDKADGDGSSSVSGNAQWWPRVRACTPATYQHPRAIRRSYQHAFQVQADDAPDKQQRAGVGLEARDVAAATPAAACSPPLRHEISFDAWLEDATPVDTANSAPVGMEATAALAVGEGVSGSILQALDAMVITADEGSGVAVGGGVPQLESKSGAGDAVKAAPAATSGEARVVKGKYEKVPLAAAGGAARVAAGGAARVAQASKVGAPKVAHPSKGARVQAGAVPGRKVAQGSVAKAASAVQGGVAKAVKGGVAKAAIGGVAKAATGGVAKAAIGGVAQVAPGTVVKAVRGGVGASKGVGSSVAALSDSAVLCPTLRMNVDMVFSELPTFLSEIAAAGKEGRRAIVKVRGKIKFTPFKAGLIIEDNKKFAR